jgi:hypothetical protein
MHEESGGGEIRTHEAFRPSGFQDRRDQPLCHPSEWCLHDCKLITPLLHDSKSNQAADGADVLERCSVGVLRGFVRQLDMFMRT